MLFLPVCLSIPHSQLRHANVLTPHATDSGEGMIPEATRFLSCLFEEDQIALTPTLLYIEMASPLPVGMAMTHDRASASVIRSLLLLLRQQGPLPAKLLLSQVTALLPNCNGYPGA